MQRLLDTGKVNGLLLGIPLGSNATGLVYNKAAIEKLNVPLPQDGWTWDEYINYGKDVKAKIGKDKYVLFDAANDMNTYDAYQLSKGKGRKVSEDGKFNIDRDTFLEWLAMHDELRAQGIVPPASVTYTDKAPDATLDLMVNGTTLFRKLQFCGPILSLGKLDARLYRISCNTKRN